MASRSQSGSVPNAAPANASCGQPRIAQNASATTAPARADQQRGADGQCHGLRDPAARAAPSPAGAAAPSRTARRRGDRSARSRPALREQRRQAHRPLGLALDRALDVEAHHVAGAFPDRVDRRLAIEARAAALPRRSRCRPALPSPRPRPPVARLQIQYFAAGVSNARQQRARASCACGASNARASRSASAVAASTSSARSASTLRISGCSASARPNAMRWRA